jgi:hypothetical protein
MNWAECGAGNNQLGFTTIYRKDLSHEWQTTLFELGRCSPVAGDGFSGVSLYDE